MGGITVTWDRRVYRPFSQRHEGAMGSPWRVYGTLEPEV